LRADFPVLLFFYLFLTNLSAPKNENPYSAHHRQYPLIYFPDYIAQAHTAIPPPPSPPAAPARPKKLKAATTWISLPIISTVALVFFNIICGYCFFSGIVALFLLIFVPIFTYFGLYRYVQNMLNEQYADLLEAHRIAQLDHQIKLQLHKANLQNYQSEAATKNFRYNLAMQYMQNRTNPPRRLRRTVARGRSEEQFYYHLVKHFGKTFIRKSMQLGDFEKPYAPDFCFIDPNTGLHIDIEIDEPYIANTQQAIHYKGADSNRNDFFVQNGWLVVRFAEEQIVKYPEACCAQIEAVRQFALYLQPQLDTHVPVVPHWTRAEAEKMAQRGTRNY
jgi:very-short-patch-repair endonuclease